VRSYPAYHGHSHCDRHAAQVKLAVEEAQVEGTTFAVPDDYVKYLNITLAKAKGNHRLLDRQRKLPEEYDKWKKDWRGIMAVCHIDYGIMKENADGSFVELPRVRWCARAQIHSDKAAGVAFFWELSWNKEDICDICSTIAEAPVWKEKGCRFEHLKELPEPVKSRRRDLPLCSEVEEEAYGRWIRRNEYFPRSEVYKELDKMEENEQQPVNLDVTTCE
jgi:hypothetical protein